MLFIALTSFISLQAQTAADYKLTTTATPSTCAKNGTITSTVTKADGTAIDMSAIDNIQYDVRNAGTDASVTGGYKVTNYAAQLPPGSYDVYVMITHNNAVQVNLAALNISIANQYVPLTLTEYGFRSFSSRVTTTFPSGASQNSLNCYPTGAYKIYVKGQGTYGIRFIEKPAAYAGTDITGRSTNAWYYLNNLPAGKYTIQIYNACEGLAYHAFEIKNVPADLPNKNLTTPYVIPLSLCGTNTSFAIANVNYTHILSTSYMDPATYNTYYFTNGFYVYNDFYEFYVATRDDAAKIDAGTLSLDNVSWIKTNGQGDGISYTFPAPVTYQQLADPAYGGTPLRLYVRLKNSTNANASCQPVYIPLELPKTDFMVGSAYAISADWVCDYYKTAVVAASFKGYL